MSTLQSTELMITISLHIWLDWERRLGHHTKARYISYVEGLICFFFLHHSSPFINLTPTRSNIGFSLNTIHRKTTTYNHMRARHPRASRESKVTYSRKYRLWIVIAVIIVLAIVIPIAIMFGRKKKAAVPRSGVLVPLYVYPSPGAWDPLYNAYVRHQYSVFHLS